MTNRASHLCARRIFRSKSQRRFTANGRPAELLNLDRDRWWNHARTVAGEGLRAAHRPRGPQTRRYLNATAVGGEPLRISCRCSPPVIISAIRSNICRSPFLSSLQEQMTRARDGRVLALGPTRCHGDHDDDDGLCHADQSGRSILDGALHHHRSRRPADRLQTGSSLLFVLGHTGRRNV